MRSIVLLTLTLGACTNVKPSVRYDWPSMSSNDRQALIEAISAKCSYPVDRMQIGPEDELHFRPQPNDEYPQVECALGELGRLRGVKLGFIGNEAYSDDRR